MTTHEDSKRAGLFSPAVTRFVGYLNTKGVVSGDSAGLKPAEAPPFSNPRERRDTISTKVIQDAADNLDRYYQRLLEELGPQGWWPAKTRLEVILGAILTQNTTWRNAALAIENLRAAGLLQLGRLREEPEARLQALIRPAGFFRQKARTIRGFVDWLDARHGGSLRRMFARPPGELRSAMLEIKGLGPETVDAILLYAGRKALFVADAYSRRILARHGLLAASSTYAEAQEFIHHRLAPHPAVYNEFHALLVEVGKRHCWKDRARCNQCPLESFLPEPQRPSAQLAGDSELQFL
ncbi:MAG TPA: endonuclease III domain-containing protein [Terriglobia bacterium]|nr:endonuclease III domain-containing protein [Terriglobia bacterium]